MYFFFIQNRIYIYVIASPEAAENIAQETDSVFFQRNQQPQKIILGIFKSFFKKTDLFKNFLLY